MMDYLHAKFKQKLKKQKPLNFQFGHKFLLINLINNSTCGFYKRSRWLIGQLDWITIFQETIR